MAELNGKRKRERAEVVSISSDMMQDFFTDDEAGRLIHRQDAPSRLPLDERELNRQAIVHRVLKTLQSDRCWPSWVRDVNVSVTSPNGKRKREASGPLTALDCGCGSGLWTLEFALAFPHCHTTGFDLAPVQPSVVPPNLFFEVMNMLSNGIDYNDAQFDLVHARLVEAVPSWKELIEDFARVLKSGGLLLITEMGVAYAANDTAMGPAWTGWQQQLDDLAKANGHRRRQGDAIAGFVRNTRHFRSVHAIRYDVPIGSWPGDPIQRLLGEQMQKAEMELTHSLEGEWLRAGLDLQELVRLRKGMQEELDDPNRHLTSSFVLTYAYRL